MLPIKELELAIRHNVADEIGMFFILENKAKRSLSKETYQLIIDHCAALTKKPLFIDWMKDLKKNNCDFSIAYRVIQAGNPKVFKELESKGLYKWQKSTINFDELLDENKALQ